VIHGSNPDFTVHRIDLGPAFILGVGRRVAFEGFVMMWIVARDARDVRRLASPPLQRPVLGRRPGVRRRL
jgi:hypothetical protein